MSYLKFLTSLFVTKNINDLPPMQSERVKNNCISIFYENKNKNIYSNKS